MPEAFDLLCATKPAARSDAWEIALTQLTLLNWRRLWSYALDLDQ